MLILIESMVLVIFIQDLQLNSLDKSLIWAIQHKRLFGITSLALLMIAYSLFAIIGRFWISNTFFIILWFVFAFANQQKMKARGAPLLPADMTFIKQPGSMISMADKGPMLKMIFAFVVIIIVSLILEKFFPIYWKNRWNLWLLRFSIICICVLSFTFSLKMTDKNSQANKFSKWMGNTQELVDPAIGAIQNGPLITFVNYMNGKTMNKPANYSRETMLTIAKKYRNTAKTINKQRKNSNLNKQTVIYVLSESFADPTRVPNLKMNADPAPEVQKIKAKNTSGLMLSSGYGGGTANMEYMVDTSMNLSLFDASMLTPFSQLVVKRSYNPNITNLFKRKHAIHTYQGELYERRQVYDKFGFQSFRRLRGKGNDALHYQKQMQNTGFIGDDEAYKEVEWQLNHEKKGQFISLATMQNHMPYTSNKYNHYDFTPSGAAVSNYNNAAEVKTFSQGISYTSMFTQQFLDNLDKYDRPITLLWYGDHLPGIYGGDNMSQNYISLHEADYFIYSNKYAREHGDSIGKQTNNVQVVSPNEFSALVLKQMNQKVTPFYAFLTKVNEMLPAQARGNDDTSNGLMVNENSEKVSSESLTRKQKALLNDYRLIQYDITVGQNYLKAEKFMK